MAGAAGRCPPPLLREEYLEYWTLDDATKWDTALTLHSKRLLCLVVSECVRDDGAHLDALGEEIRACCDAPFWIFPGHDWNCEDRDGRRITIDLHSAMWAWSLAEADWLLGDRLPGVLRQRLREEVERRVFEPYRDCAIRRSRELWWLDTSNNWNAVCHAGVIGAALTLIESRRERAEFLGAALTFLETYLEGFGEDGGCNEGITYWNYGFSHYLFLSEMVRKATGGAIDLLADPRIPAIAMFAPRMEIQGGVFPAIADSNLGATPSAWTVGLLSRRLGLGLGSWEARIGERDSWTDYQTYSASMVLFTDPEETREASAAGQPPREWFPARQIYIGRGPGNFGVALKGGNNGEHHNHNDLGAFTIVVNARPLVLDAGRELYNKRTFSEARYESPLNNSFGHSVPLVDGTLQACGCKAAAHCLHCAFSEAADELVFELTSAYPVPGLVRLIRHFSWVRTGPGEFEVREEFQARRPIRFGTALVIADAWERISERELRIHHPSAALVCTITASAGMEISSTPLDVVTPGRFVPGRMAIDLKEPACHGVIRTVFRPA